MWINCCEYFDQSSVSQIGDLLRNAEHLQVRALNFVVYLFLADENEKSVSIASFGDNGYICESRVYANQ